MLKNNSSVLGPIMKTILSTLCFASCSALLLLQPSAIPAQDNAKANAKAKGKAAPPPMNFFVTSVGIGNGGDLGGLAGADAHCQQLAEAVGADNFTWRAYLSTQAADGQPAVNARDRIGQGPWYGAVGRMIARDLAHLHGDTHELALEGNTLHKISAVNERGEQLNGMADDPNRHDILTGSQINGTAYPAGDDHTCSNWTSSAETGSAQVGHFDRLGGTTTSWVSAHGSLGCSQEAFARTGGAGYLYCFGLPRE